MSHAFRKLRRHRRAISALGAFALVLMAAGSAFAFAAPEAGDPGFDLYNFIVNQMLAGPIGLVAGIIAFGYGAYLVIGRSAFALGVPAIIGGVMIMKLDSIVRSFGAMIA